MASMLVVTIVLNVIGWALFTLTDLFLGSLSFAHMIVLAEWFVIPMAASAIYRGVTGADRFSDANVKTMYMLMWFVLGAGMSAVVCKAVDAGKWFASSSFNRFDYLSFATAFVLGFIIYSVAYEIIRRFVDGGFDSHRIVKGH